MQTRMWKSTSGLGLVLFSLATGGCQFFSSDKASEANASASDAPVPSEVVDAESLENEVPAPTETAKKTQVIAATPLTRPTDPDARVKAIKRGRSNPFAELRPAPGKVQNTPQPTQSARSNVNIPGTRSALKNQPKASPSPKVAVAPTRSTLPRPSSTSLPRLSNPAPSSAKNDAVVLPPLPEATLAKQVKVQGILTLGSQPKAIITAPDEEVARTVQVGDTIAKGQVLITAIDVSNPQNPKLVLQEAGQTVTVGIGQEAESLTASLPF